MKQIIITLAALTLSCASFADNHEKHEKSHPCKEIKEACEAAGFTKGGHKNKKGLQVDCIKKLMNGESVEGVTVDAAKISACKEKKDSHAEKKKHH